MTSINIGGPAVSPIPDVHFGGGGFNPTSLITGAGGFWRADMGTTLSGSNVTQWNDQSSFANNLTNNGTASNVTFSSTGFNTSFAAVSIADNSNGTMRVTAPFAAGTTLTLFILVQPNATASSNNRWAWLSANTGNDFTTPSLTSYNPTAANNFQPYSSNPQGSPITTVNGTPILLGVVFDGANVNTWKNGSVFGSPMAFTSNLGASSNTVFGLGNSLDLNASDGTAVGAHYAFWGITQKAMNSTDWGNLKTWSNSNWGTSF